VVFHIALWGTSSAACAQLRALDHLARYGCSRPNLVVLHETGYLPFSLPGGELLFRPIMMLDEQTLRRGHNAPAVGDWAPRFTTPRRLLCSTGSLITAASSRPVTKSSSSRTAQPTDPFPGPPTPR
jgi:hypothetical protein